MKQLLFIFTLLLLFVGCCSEDDSVGGEVPPFVYDVKISPVKIQRGQELTVTFNVKYYKIYNEYLKSVQLIDGQLIDVSENKSEYRSKNHFVKFNLGIKDGAKPSTKTSDEKISVCYETVDYNSANAINPERYTYFNWSPETGDGEIRCIVPAEAVSGVIKLEGLGISNCGFSGEKLIVVDDDGNEIK